MTESLDQNQLRYTIAVTEVQCAGDEAVAYTNFNPERIASFSPGLRVPRRSNAKAGATLGTVSNGPPTLKGLRLRNEITCVAAEVTRRISQEFRRFISASLTRRLQLWAVGILFRIPSLTMRVRSGS